VQPGTPGGGGLGRLFPVGRLGRRRYATDNLLRHPVQQRQCSRHDAADAVDVRHTGPDCLRVVVDLVNEVCRIF